MSISISSAARHFLAKYVASSDDLDVLMIVASAPQREWSALEISDRLRIDPISASNRLMSLYLSGLLAHDERVGKLYRYRYHTTRALDKITSEIAQAYSLHRAELCEFVEQSQRSQMLAFADAFHLKKDR